MQQCFIQSIGNWLVQHRLHDPAGLLHLLSRLLYIVTRPAQPSPQLRPSPHPHSPARPGLCSTNANSAASAHSIARPLFSPPSPKRCARCPVLPASRRRPLPANLRCETQLELHRRLSSVRQLV